MKLNYSKICSDLTQDLSEKGREVILRRFGLNNEKRETLENIGKSHNITRERVRQIQEDAMSKIKPKAKEYKGVFDYFTNEINSYGGLKREDVLLNILGENKFQNHALFLLNIGDPFIKFSNTDEFHSFWTTNLNLLPYSKKTINSFYDFLIKKKEPIMPSQLFPNQVFGKETSEKKINTLSLQAFQSFLEISKKVQKNKEGFFGLKNWPEINPKGIKDKAYLVFKKEQKPLHFNEVASLISNDSKCNPQSVHNELIKDQRFILIGRGIYALQEWGYKKGVVQDIIIDILKEVKKPLEKKEIIGMVLKQRMVKPNTILLSLNNRKYFSKNSEGKYSLIRKSI